MDELLLVSFVNFYFHPSHQASYFSSVYHSLECDYLFQALLKVFTSLMLVLKFDDQAFKISDFIINHLFTLS